MTEDDRGDSCKVISTFPVDGGAREQSELKDGEKK
jgi:hypothetical protein